MQPAFKAITALISYQSEILLSLFIDYEYFFAESNIHLFSFKNLLLIYEFFLSLFYSILTNLFLFTFLMNFFLSIFFLIHLLLIFLIKFFLLTILLHFVKLLLSKIHFWYFSIIFEIFYFDFQNHLGPFLALFQVLQLYLQHFQCAISTSVQFEYAF